MKFAELTQIALLGTERQSISIPPATTSLGRIETQIDANQRERALLSLAALDGLYERIGSLALRDNAPLPQPCPVEQATRISERAGSLLQNLLDGGFAQLLPEWLVLATEAQLIAPPETLPPLLNFGASKSELREAILPVLGERGRWLAAQNPEWPWVSGASAENEDIWHVEERPARLSFLQKLRRTNPVRARELLAATWKEETSEDRAAFIATFETGLTLDDEPLLESALDDKRKEVRRAASRLLVRLPDSALVKRMIERLKPLLGFVPGAAGSVLKLKKSKPAAIEVTLPGECDATMQRDGIELKPLPGFGEKASWFIQMLEVPPLDLWAHEWNSTPEEIFAASLQGEWKKELFEAWMRAAICQRNAAWAEVLFDAALDGKRADKFEGLLATMTPAQREARLSGVLSQNDKKIRDFAGILANQCNHAWSPSFSRSVLDFMRRECAQESGDWALRNQFKDFAIRLAPEVLAEAPNGWPVDSKSWEFWSKVVDEFLAVTQFRAEMRAALKS